MRANRVATLLAISVVTNIVFATRFYFPGAFDQVLQAIQSPPRPVASDHWRGNEKADLTVIVYTDFQCPYCAALDSTLTASTNLDRTRQIYRHFPLNSHPQARAAAEAAECAGAQGKFWEYVDALFRAKGEFADARAFLRIAGLIKLDNQAFRQCIESHAYAQRVADDVEDGKSRRIVATPTFYVNGKRFSGALPAEEIAKLVHAGVR